MDIAEGGKFILGQGFDLAIKGWEGKLQDIVANYGLGNIEKIMQKVATDFKLGADDFTVFGSIKYWDGILGKIKDANQKLGIAGNLGTNLQGSFREAYPLVVDMGIKAEDMAKSIQSYFTDTGRAQILSSNEMAEISKMAAVFGDESLAIVTTYGKMGLGIEASTKRMRNLIVESNKFGVLPTKVSGLLKANIDAVNKYHFKNGVQALEKMAIYAAKTNTDMSAAFTMADKILEGGIEGTMEMSTDLQLLGGSFGNLGNISELIYLARNDVGKFNEILHGAAADMVDFNETTGEFDYGSEGMHRLRQVAKSTNVDLSKLVEGGKALKKSMLIGDELDSSLKGLDNYDAIITKVSGAAFMNKSGDWVVKMKKDGKEIEQAVSALTDDQIKEISFTDETKGPEAAFENIAKSNERLVETMNRLVETLKTSALSAAPYEQFSQVIRTAADNIKESAAPLIKSFSELNEKAFKNVMNVIKPLSEGNVKGALEGAGDNLADAGNMVMGGMKDVGQILYNVFANAAKFLAAGLEWGFKRGVVHFQNGFIAAYNATGLSDYFGKGKTIEPDKEDSFLKILEGNNLKGVLSGTEFEKWWTDVSKSNPASNTTTQAVPQTNTNAPVENKPVSVGLTAPDTNSISSVNNNKNYNGELKVTGGFNVTIDGKDLSYQDNESVQRSVIGAITGDASKFTVSGLRDK